LRRQRQKSNVAYVSAPWWQGRKEDALYIVVDLDTLTEKAYPTLQAARYAALNVKRGEVYKIVLNGDLPNPELRCALFNRNGFASERTLVATIANGIARKIAPQ
jgi:hypothetical protein